MKKLLTIWFGAVAAFIFCVEFSLGSIEDGQTNTNGGSTMQKQKVVANNGGLRMKQRYVSENNNKAIPRSHAARHRDRRAHARAHRRRRRHLGTVHDKISSKEFHSSLHHRRHAAVRNLGLFGGNWIFPIDQWLATNSDPCWLKDFQGCENCTSTISSDGDNYCNWYSGPGYCDSNDSLDGDVPVVSCDDEKASNNNPLMMTWCDGCLNSGGAWAVEECFHNCSSIPSVYDSYVCYSSETFPENSTSEICNMVDTDSQLCYDKSYISCENCVNFTLSDDNTRCTWYPEDGLCFSTSSPYMDGSSSCGTDRVTNNIEQYYWCGGCVENGLAWTGTECRNSCADVMDGVCYSYEQFGKSTTRDEICAKEDDDFQLCIDQMSQQDCQGSMQSDGIHSCYWDGDSCDKIDFSYHTCEGCLDKGGSWYESSSCAVACNENTNPGEICYGFETFKSGNSKKVCDNIETDFLQCSGKDDCDSCTNTFLSDDVSTCKWYAEWEYCDHTNFDGAASTC